ncbi:hypothetical protein ABZZ80_40410, partial [Streptomyces sp. NPDC006356]
MRKEFITFRHINVKAVTPFTGLPDSAQEPLTLNRFIASLGAQFFMGALPTPHVKGIPVQTPPHPRSTLSLLVTAALVACLLSLSW